MVRNRALTAVGIWNMLTIAGWIGSQTAATMMIVMSAPTSPQRIPSRMNGQRMNESEAPTSRMISISPARLKTAMRIVLMIRKRTVSPTSPTIAMPTVRIVLMTPREGVVLGLLRQDPLDEPVVGESVGHVVRRSPGRRG